MKKAARTPEAYTVLIKEDAMSVEHDEQSRERHLAAERKARLAGVPPISARSLGGHLMLIEEHGPRRVVLCGKREPMQTCDESGLLVNVEKHPETLERLTECYNACSVFKSEPAPAISALIDATNEHLNEWHAVPGNLVKAEPASIKKARSALGMLKERSE